MEPADMPDPTDGDLMDTDDPFETDPPPEFDLKEEEEVQDEAVDAEFEDFEGDSDEEFQEMMQRQQQLQAPPPGNDDEDDDAMMVDPPNPEIADPIIESETQVENLPGESDTLEDDAEIIGALPPPPSRPISAPKEMIPFAYFARRGRPNNYLRRGVTRAAPNSKPKGVIPTPQQFFEEAARRSVFFFRRTPVGSVTGKIAANSLNEKGKPVKRDPALVKKIYKQLKRGARKSLKGPIVAKALKACKEMCSYDLRTLAERLMQPAFHGKFRPLAIIVFKYLLSRPRPTAGGDLGRIELFLNTFVLPHLDAVTEQWKNTHQGWPKLMWRWIEEKMLQPATQFKSMKERTAHLIGIHINMVNEPVHTVKSLYSIPDLPEDESYKHVLPVVLVELLCEWAPPVLNLKLSWKRRPVPPLQSPIIMDAACRLFCAGFYETAGKLVPTFNENNKEKKWQSNWPRSKLDCCIAKFTINCKGKLLYEDPRPFLKALAELCAPELPYYFAHRILSEYHRLDVRFRGPRGDPTDVLFHYMMQPCLTETNPKKAIEMIQHMKKLADDWPRPAQKLILSLCSNIHAMRRKANVQNSTLLQDSLAALLTTSITSVSQSETFEYGSFVEFDRFVGHFKLWLDGVSPLSALRKRKLQHTFIQLANSANHRFCSELSYALRTQLPDESRLLFRSLVQNLFNLVMQRLKPNAPDARYNFFDYPLTQRIPRSYLVRKFIHRHPDTYYTFPIRSTFLDAGRVGSHFMEMLDELESSVVRQTSIAETCSKIHIEPTSKSEIHLMNNDGMTLYAIQALKLMLHPTVENFQKIAARMDPPGMRPEVKPSVNLLHYIHKSLPYQFDLRLYSAIQPILSSGGPPREKQIEFWRSIGVGEDDSVGLAEYFAANLLAALRNEALTKKVACFHKSRKKIIQAIFSFTIRNWWPFSHIPKNEQQLTDECLAECFTLLLKGPNVFDFKPEELMFIQDCSKIHPLLRSCRQITNPTSKAQALKLLKLCLELYELDLQKALHKDIMPKVNLASGFTFILWGMQRWPVYTPTFHTGVKGAAIAPALMQASPHPKIPANLLDVRVVDMGNPDCAFRDPGLRTFGQSGMDPLRNQLNYLLHQLTHALMQIDIVCSSGSPFYYWRSFEYI